MSSILLQRPLPKTISWNAGGFWLSLTSKSIPAKDRKEKKKSKVWSWFQQKYDIIDIQESHVNDEDKVHIDGWASHFGYDTYHALAKEGTKQWGVTTFVRRSWASHYIIFPKVVADFHVLSLTCYLTSYGPEFSNPSASPPAVYYHANIYLKTGNEAVNKALRHSQIKKLVDNFQPVSVHAAIAKRHSADPLGLIGYFGGDMNFIGDLTGRYICEKGDIPAHYPSLSEGNQPLETTKVWRILM